MGAAAGAAAFKRAGGDAVKSDEERFRPSSPFSKGSKPAAGAGAGERTSSSIGGDAATSTLGPATKSTNKIEAQCIS